MNYKKYIKEVANFPNHGVCFKDISPLLANNDVYRAAVGQMAKLIHSPPDYWVGIDARGFLFASSLALQVGGGVVLCRKAGKLPPPTVSHIYNTEYSKDELSMHPGMGRVIIVDDVLATGGTMKAANLLCTKAGYEVIDNIALIDLEYIPKELDITVKSLVKYV